MLTLFLLLAPPPQAPPPPQCPQAPKPAAAPAWQRAADGTPYRLPGAGEVANAILTPDGRVVPLAQRQGPAMPFQFAPAPMFFGGFGGACGSRG